MPDLNEIWDHLLPSAALEDLDGVLRRCSGMREKDLYGLLAPISKAGYERYIVGYLESFKFLEKAGGRWVSNLPNWDLYRTLIVPREKLPSITRYTPLINMPSAVPYSEHTGTIKDAFDSFIAGAQGRTFIVNPFLDQQGAEELTDVVQRLLERGTEVTLVVRIIPGDNSNNVALASVLARFKRRSDIQVLNFHYQAPRSRYVRLSFHAKGLYGATQCVLATMNFIDANMERNVEFGIHIRGEQARRYHVALQAVAAHTKPMSIEDAQAALTSASSVA